MPWVAVHAMHRKLCTLFCTPGQLIHGHFVAYLMPQALCSMVWAYVLSKADILYFECQPC